jgi:hypothetical protein
LGKLKTIAEKNKGKKAIEANERQIPYSSVILSSNPEATAYFPKCAIFSR